MGQSYNVPVFCVRLTHSFHLQSQTLPAAQTALAAAKRAGLDQRVKRARKALSLRKRRKMKMKRGTRRRKRQN